MKINYNLKTNPYILWGATGQSIMLEETLREEFDLEVIFDNNKEIKSPFKKIPILHQWNSFLEWSSKNDIPRYSFIVAIGGGEWKSQVRNSQ